MFYDVASALPMDWGGAGLWGPQQVVVTVMSLLRPGTTQSYKTCLPAVQTAVGRSRWGWERAPDPRGFSDARMRCGAAPMRTAALAARDRALALAATSAPDQRGPLGRPMAAFDGTDLLVFEDPGTRSRYGGVTNAEGKPVGQPHALMVSAWDVVNRIPLGWTLMPYGSDERVGARTLLPTLDPATIAVFDRGYPSRAFLRDMALERRDFVIRMIASESAGWSEVQAFFRSGERERIVIMDLGPHPEHPGQRVLRAIRLIRRPFRPGRPKSHQSPETWVIATSLVDPTYTTEDLIEVYHQRWSIETIHKELKVLCAVETWHTSNPDLIEQEIAAIMIWQSLAAAIQIQVQNTLNRRRANPWNLPDRALAVRTMVMSAVAELLDHARQGRARSSARTLLKRHVDLMADWAQKRRPGRSTARVCKRPHGRSKSQFP
jgi:hypothetical protein